MARNWEMASRNGIGQIMDKYYEGTDRARNIAKEKADNQREGQQWAFKETKNYRQPVLDEHGFVKGYETNQDTRRRNVPIMRNLRPEFFRDRPGATPAAPAATPPAAQPAGPQAEQNFEDSSQEKTPSGRPIGRTYEEQGERSPNGSLDPKPLLVDKKAELGQAQLAQDGLNREADRAASADQNQAKIASSERQAEASNEVKRQAVQTKLPSGKPAILEKGTTGVEYVDQPPGQPGQVYLGKNAQGVDQYGFGAQKTNVSRGDDLVVQGRAPRPPALTPAQSGLPDPATMTDEQLAEFDPDDYLMGQIQTMATTPSARALEPMVSGKAIGQVLGVNLPDVQLPASMWREVIRGEYGNVRAGIQAGGKQVPPEVVPYLTQVESGAMSPGEAIQAMQQDGVPITSQAADALYKAKGTNFGQQRIDDANARADAVAKRIASTSYKNMVGKTVAAVRDIWQPALDQLDAIKKVEDMANSGDTNGMKGMINTMRALMSGQGKNSISNLDVRMQSGVEDFAGRMEQAMMGFTEGELSPENIRLINRLTGIFRGTLRAKMSAGTERERRAFVFQAGLAGIPEDVANEQFDQNLDPESLLDAYSGLGPAPRGRGGAATPPPSPGSAPKSKVREQFETAKAQLDAALKAGQVSNQEYRIRLDKMQTRLKAMEAGNGP